MHGAREEASSTAHLQFVCTHKSSESPPKQTLPTSPAGDVALCWLNKSQALIDGFPSVSVTQSQNHFSIRGLDFPIERRLQTGWDVAVCNHSFAAVRCDAPPSCLWVYLLFNTCVSAASIPLKRRPNASVFFCLEHYRGSSLPLMLYFSALFTKSQSRGLLWWQPRQQLLVVHSCRAQWPWSNERVPKLQGEPSSSEVHPDSVTP